MYHIMAERGMGSNQACSAQLQKNHCNACIHGKPNICEVCEPPFLPSDDKSKCIHAGSRRGFWTIIIITSSVLGLLFLLLGIYGLCGQLSKIRGKVPVAFVATPATSSFGSSTPTKTIP